MSPLGLFITILWTAVTIILLAYAYSQIQKPTLLLNVMNKFAGATAVYPLEGGTETENSTIYNKGSKRCLVWLPGGGFLSAERVPVYGLANTLHAIKDFDCDQIIIQYPCRFDYTLTDSLIAIGQALAPIVGKYEHYHIAGISAGAFLAGVFVKKESDATMSNNIRVSQIGIEFESCSFLSPFLWLKLSIPFLNTLGEKYLGGGTVNFNYYNCSSMPLPTLIVTSVADPLYSQAAQYIVSAKKSDKYYVYDDDGATGHAFMQDITKPRTQEVILNLVKFINENTND